MGRIPAAAKRNAILWLSQGISPRRLALTLALGFAVGCIPVVGIPTVLCAGLALALAAEPARHSGRKLRRHAPATGAHRSFCAAGRLDCSCQRIRRGFWRRAPLEHLLCSQSCHTYERNGGPGIAGLAGGRYSGGPADDAALNLMLRRIPVLKTAQAGD